MPTTWKQQLDLWRDSPWRNSRWFRWMLGPVAILAAYLVEQGTILLVGPQSGIAYIFYYYFLMAVLVTAWVGGTLPGLATCLLAVLSLPNATAGYEIGGVNLTRLGLFVGFSLAGSGVAEAQRRHQRRLLDSNRELDERVAARTAELATAVAHLETEVAERRRTEQALRQSEQRVDMTLDAAGIGRWDLDLASGRMSRSPGHDKIYGYNAPQVVWTYETSLGHLHPEDRHVAETTLQSVISQGETFEFDTRIVRCDGELRWVWWRGRVLRNESGKAVHLLGSVRDITASKRAEERLQVQLERLNLLDQITRGIGERHDLRSIFQVTIRSLEDHLPLDFGCMCLYDQAAGVLDVTCVGVRSGELAIALAMEEQARIPIDQNGLSRCVRGQLVYEPDVAGIDAPFPARLAQGGLRALVAAPLLVANEVLGVVIAARKQPHSFRSSDCEFLRQLSEHVALAAHQASVREALQSAYDELHRSQQTVMQQERLRALGQMASGIAHDINNAISPVTLYTETLLETEPNLSPRARSCLETIHRAIDDVAETVARMRQFYRPQESQLVLMPVDLGMLVHQVLELTSPHWSDLAQKEGSTIHAVVQVETGLPAVLGIESEIREALTNLVLNAVDALPGGGELTLRAHRVPDDSGTPRIHLEVADSGVGMDEDTRRRCVEPFFTTKGERGTGLGLAMVYGVAQRHQAHVEIESAPGRGTVARLVFPVPEASAGVVEPEAAGLSLPPMRLLIVDDDPLLIRSLADTLELDGHSVTSADGGQAGIDMFRRQLSSGAPFAAVITDLGMPYVDGRKVAAAIKAASPATPVILLTGWGQRLVEEGDVPQHIDRVLSKPPKLRDLRRALSQCVAASGEQSQEHADAA